MPVAYIQQNGQAPPIMIDGNEVCLEEGRLNTFDSSWPHADDSSCSKDKMARAGFFYYGHSDQVKCFVCLKKLAGWEPEQDDPWAKHKELSSKCLFATYGKEESDLTVEQWCDMICSRTINILEGKFNKLQEALSTD